MGSSANTNQQETVLFASAVMRLLYASAHAPRKIENAVQNAAQSAPAQNAPAQNAPAQKVPAPEAVKPEASVPKATVQEVPVTETPAQKAEEPKKAKKGETAKKPEKQEAAAPVTEVPAEQAPIEQAPVEQTPIEQAPVEQLPAVETEEEEAFVEETEEEKNEIRQSFWQKLKNGLAKTRKAIFGSIDDLLKNFVKVDEDLLEELEELLITSDISVDVTEDIIDQLRDRIKDGRLTEKEQVMGALREILTDMIGKEEPLHLDTVPSVILVIGVNGAGKTTSIGKISKRLRLSGKKVVVAAADTFRAAAKSGYIGVGDDSGLTVDALGGAPGIYSARYAGTHGDDAANNALLLRNLENVGERTAHFVCCIACVFPDGESFTAEGITDGSILYAPQGTDGFGYDPLFFCPETGKTFASMTQEEKNAVSHRGKAIRLFADRLAQRLEKEQE